MPGDPDAPILKHADAALVGDPAKVAKELAVALSKILMRIV